MHNSTSRLLTFGPRRWTAYRRTIIPPVGCWETTSTISICYYLARKLILLQRVEGCVDGYRWLVTCTYPDRLSACKQSSIQVVTCLAQCQLITLTEANTLNTTVRHPPPSSTLYVSMVFLYSKKSLYYSCISQSSV